MPDKHDERYVKGVVEPALNKLMSEDYQLFKNNANERSMTHKFAEHLSPLFPTWHVDCEYNRDGCDIKKVHLEPKAISSDNDKGDTVVPDIIVHERETSNNLLVIEARKDTNSSDQDDLTSDKKKLKAYKRDLENRVDNERGWRVGRNPPSVLSDIHLIGIPAPPAEVMGAYYPFHDVGWHFTLTASLLSASAS